MEIILATLASRVALQSDPSNDMWERVQCHREMNRTLRTPQFRSKKIDCLPVAGY